MDQELVQYLDERFQGLDRRFERIDQRFEQIDQRFEQVDRRFEAVDRRFDEVNERIEEVKRHSGVLVEGLRHELQLVAEGLITHINVRHAEDRAYVDQRFQETNALVRLSLESTDQLRQRVENLERKSPN
jgi:hypothetical protein